MVKEEDKGRGCMTGHGMGGVSSWIFPDNFRNAALSPGNFKFLFRQITFQYDLLKYRLMTLLEAFGICLRTRRYGDP
jgi:hypothetical protein